MATYVNNLRLTELATGEGSGTWGTTTNTNLELIGQALGFGTRAIANASTDNITIADGASDADRAMYLKLTGGGQACTVTILPNTTSKVWWMENATSYTLTFTCGSGANVAVLAGETKCISTDGLGSGGAVYDVLTDVNLAGTTKVDDLVVGDALTVGGTLGVTGVLTTTAATVFNGGFASNADSTLGTDKKVQFRDAAIYLNSSADGQLDIVADTEIQIAATTVDLNGNLDVSGTLGVTGAATFTGEIAANGGIDVTGTVTADKLITDSNVDAASFTSASSTYVDINNGTVTGRLQTISSDFFIGTATVGTSLAFKSGNGVEAIRVDSSQNVGIGTSSPTSKLQIGGMAAGEQALLIESARNDALSNGLVRINITDSVCPFAGLQIDHAGTGAAIIANGNVGIGRTPDTVYSGSLQLAFGNGSQLATSTAGNPSLTITDNSYLNASGNHVYKTTNPSTRLEQYNGTLTFFNAASGTAGATISYAERLRIDASGNVGIGNTVASSMNAGANQLVVGSGSTGQGITLYSSTSTAGSIHFADGTSGNEAYRGQLVYNHTSDYMAILTAATERARLTSDGNLLVGKTSTAFGTEGFVYEAGAAVEVTTDSNRVMRLNRTTSDGNIIELNKDGTTVGSIGTNSGYMVIGSPVGTDAHLLIGNGLIHPATSTGAAKDNAIDIGGSSNRFKDLYLSGGVYLGGTGAANLLDDFEEGTWTPSLGGDATYTTQVGNYTKIGNLVTIRGSVVVDVLGTGSTTIVSGLPFAESSTNNFTGSVCSYFADIAVSLSVLIASADLSSSTIKFTGQGAAGTTMAVPTVFASGSRVDFAFSYEV
jgi:hypothetical protein